ncbi:MAG: hypothetical protein ACI8XO_003390 [Verrucomicrobiales bacterium]|jgi:hypothetical protein
MQRSFLQLCLLSFFSVSVTAAPDFIKDVAPILEVNCVRCHNPEKSKGKLELHTRAAALKGGSEGAAYIAGDAKASELIRRVMLPLEDDEFMPHQSDPLTKAQLQTLKQWVAGGAEWPQGVVLEQKKASEVAELKKEAPLVPATAPGSEAEAIARIGNILDAENAREHPDLQVAGAIDELAYLRKATVDLIGRIPSHAEITGYLEWPSGDRRRLLVEGLLEESRFNERWTVFFADMLRVRSNATGGRELLAHVHRSVAEKKPWDEMASELIAANGATKKTPAVGFVLNDNAEPLELAAATAQVFLGVRMQCAMCHDHPFDDWKQKEFYEFAGFFGKTKRVENRFSRQVYTTEGHEMMVKWPPEREKPPTREAVAPKFPFELVSYEKPPHFLKRFEAKRKPAEAAGVAEGESIDDLLDIDAEGTAKGETLGVLAEAMRESRDLEVEKDVYRQSELRAKLAKMVTDPRNPYFAKSFVNRIWAELMGRGFVEPLDNFSDYNEISHPQTMEYLAQEFTASGFDLRALVKMIVLSEPYRRGQPQGDVEAGVLELAREVHAAGNVRRMLSEPLYDSIVLAGHLDDYKWPKGANVRKIERQIRVPIGEQPKTDRPAMSEVAMNAGTMEDSGAAGGYDLEQGIGLDFEEILKQADREAREIDRMKREQDAKLKAAAQARMMAEANRPAMRYTLKTIEEEIDDNPKFDSTLRMASPAPPAHFLRVFGQPSRDRLGEFRDESPSMRQALMMINGKAIHEAARVGPLEPIHQKLGDPEAAVKHAYLEILTREPSAQELGDAQTLLKSAGDVATGLADLRWALFNCHEFRYLP